MKVKSLCLRGFIRIVIFPYTEILVLLDLLLHIGDFPCNKGIFVPYNETNGLTQLGF